MRNIEKRINDLHEYIIHAEKQSNDISTVNVGWHIEHALLVIIKIIETVTKSEPSKYKWKFNWARIIVFMINKFPRGKADAPDIVKPNQHATPDFESIFYQARKSIATLKQVQANNFFLHPIFGNLNKKNTFIMLDIHTQHHINIIKDIIKSAT